MTSADDERLIAAYEDWLNSRSPDEDHLAAERYEKTLEQIAQDRRERSEAREAEYGTDFWKEDR
jgi:hypothetical protein